MKVKKISAKNKIMLWFVFAFVVLVLFTCIINFSVGRHVLNQNIQERLVGVVNNNAEEIEYVNSRPSSMEENDFFLNYKNGILEIDDDFCDYYEGIYTALVDSDNNLLYGEIPVNISKEKAFTFSSAKKVQTSDGIYYVYEKKLSGDSLEGLWLRGFVSEKETKNLLYTVIHISLWFIPALAVLALSGGYLIIRRVFRPVDEIRQMAAEIAASADLSKRIPLNAAENAHSNGTVKESLNRDELYNLAETFNIMLSQLEQAFERERQFTSDASHELRTPMAVIKAQCEYALSCAETKEDYVEALEVIQRQSDDMAELLSQLLFFARLQQTSEKLQLNDTDVSALLTLLCDERRLLLHENDDEEIKLLTDIAPDLHTASNEGLLKRLISNLLDNAFKYGRGKPVTVSLIADETVIRLDVTDRGAGISPEDLKKIWDRFYQADTSRTDSEERGFGLGLSMVKEIGDLLGAKIEVVSAPNEGSTFSVIMKKL